jgi:large subunit ribosomal protein L9
MQVVLLEDVQNLGKRGETVAVKDGFARNFLLPRSLALPATSRGLKMKVEADRVRVVKELKIHREAEELAKALGKVSCTAEVQAGEDDRVFGSVTSADIAELLKTQGFEIDKRKIVIDEPLKALGVYTISVRLASDVEAKVKVWVVKKSN